ncbi:hypothetical protein [Candidatus Nephthysia bennettiae]|uniref:Uncharacterized protein n=1 Tax=Candidatus Nephthysia bennettiae TaxID=3127016 RepID=A0A934K752_9BACT|nr:hypothetical protein [Candidatus Dormibacteraeota bacterium]
MRCLAASEQLTAVIPLLTSTGNARDLAVVHRMVGKIRRRWPRAAELRQLDELLGVGIAGKRSFEPLQ